MMKRLLFLLVLTAGFSPAFSQWNEPLPARFAPGEEALMDAYLSTRMGATSGITTPPQGPVRTAAEWEEIKALFVSWKGYSSTLTEIVRNAREECLVVIICPDSNAVKTTLNNAGVNLSNIDFLQFNSNSVWIRDYGANTVYLNDVDSLVMVDWIYNRPRPADDVVPDQLSTFFNVPLYSTTAAPNDLMNTGGNFMSDGMGTAFASKLILQENDGSGPQAITYPNHTLAEIDSIMKDFMGIDRYIKMETLPYDGIHHIDMHMKLLDEETLLVGQYPAGVSDGPQIEANLQYVLSNFNSSFGTPYEVVRVVMPPDGGGQYPVNFGDYRTYANAVFINKTVLVPTYAQQYDTTALRIWRESLPGYRVVGINCNSIIQASGALHCVTHSLGVNDPMWITHQRLRDTYNTATDYTVTANIEHRSGVALATLYYTTDTTQAYTAVPMSNSGGNSWSAPIPAQNAGTEIFYYISATSNSGRTVTRPLPAPEGYWNFEVLSLTAAQQALDAGLVLNPVFPNPAGAITCVPVFTPMPEQARVRLLDVMGREVQLLFDGLLPAGDSKFFFDASRLSAGTYLLLVEGAGKTLSQKVLVR